MVAVDVPPVAAVVWYLSPRKRRVTRLNLRAVYPGLDEKSRSRIARASMTHYVRGVFEAGMLWHWPLERVFEYFGDEIDGIVEGQLGNETTPSEIHDLRSGETIRKA